jgi:signal transduction histidine kinase/CheY-like chemotaxis protein
MSRLVSLLHRQPIARKLAWMIAGTAAAGLVLMSGAVILNELVSYPTTKRAELEALADIVGANSRGALMFSDQQRAAQSLWTLQDSKSILSARILDSQGRWFAGYERKKKANAQMRSVAVEREISFDGQRIGSIGMVAELDEAYDRLARYLILMATFLVTDLILVILLTTRVRRLISEPILRLARAAEALSRHDYSVRAEKLSDDEIGALTDAFNKMVEEVSARTESLLAANDQLEVARRKADAASDAKAQFLANMSHEIRTPMNGILGMLALARDTTLNPEQTEYLSTAHSSAKSLLNLLDGILTLSKIEAGKLTLESTDFDLYQLVDNVHRLMALGAQQKGLEMMWRLGPGVPRMVNGDPTRLSQVLINLLGNATKFTGAGEVVTIGQVAGPEEPYTLQFLVRDTGIGVTAEQQSRILEPFEQADGSTTRVYGGSGLGLSISRKLITLMGGELEVSSTPGEGSEFRFLVRFRPAEGLSSGNDLPKPRFDGEQVLLVESNRTNREMLAEMLRSAGLSVQAAGDSGEALRLASSGPPGGFAAILSDAALPGVDGFQFARSLEKSQKNSVVLILLLTGTDLARSMERCRSLGIHYHLIKPIAEDSMLRVLARLLQQRSVEQAASAEPQKPAEPPAGQTGRILVAEDNLVNQRVAAALLEKRRHQVTVVSNGAEAVELVMAGGFDLVFMDVQMPVMDGIAATEAIRQAERARGWPPIPIIALSAHAMAGDYRAGLKAGMDGYLPKPLQPDQLWRTVDSVLRGEKDFPGSREQLTIVTREEPSEEAEGTSLDCPVQS